LRKAKAAAAVMPARPTIRKPAIALGLMAKESFSANQVGRLRTGPTADYNRSKLLTD